MKQNARTGGSAASAQAMPEKIERLFKMRVIDMTGEDLGDLVSFLRGEKAESPAPRHAAAAPAENPIVAYGVAQLARCIGKSPQTIFRYKKQGVFDGLYGKVGRTLVFDVTAINQRLVHYNADGEVA